MRPGCATRLHSRFVPEHSGDAASPCQEVSHRSLRLTRPFFVKIGCRFFSFVELYGAIRELTINLNDRPMRNLGATRRALFEAIECGALLDMPADSCACARMAIIGALVQGRDGHESIQTLDRPEASGSQPTSSAGRSGHSRGGALNRMLRTAKPVTIRC